ncbi:MAG: hypothetical protein HC917_28705 [Richelia sp. SM2_1_7]|nr:hypothetical protein [Richelia sp. SM2_1_7]
MNKFYIAQLVHGVPILIESTYTAELYDEYILTARDNSRCLLGGIANELPPVIHKRDTFSEIVDALHWLVNEAASKFNELIENSHIEEQLEELITALQLRCGGSWQ